MTAVKYVSWNDVNNALVSFGVAIENAYGLDVEYDRKRYDSAIGPSKKDKSKYSVHIGTAGYIFAGFSGKVPECDFVRTVLSLYHEERHLQQNRLDFLSLDDPAGTDGTCLDKNQACRLAKYHLTGDVVPEFYHAINMRDPVEHDAELYALRETKSFFNEHFPEIDVEACLVEIIKSESTHSPGWYADVTDSYDGLVENLNKAFRDNAAQPHANIMSCQLKNGPSPMMTKFADRSELVLELATCDTLDGQMEVLLRFVVSLEPERLIQYSCLCGDDNQKPVELDRSDGEWYRLGQWPDDNLLSRLHQAAYEVAKPSEQPLSSEEQQTCPEVKFQEDTHEMTVKMADPEHRDTYELKEMSNKPVTSDRKKHDDLEPKPGEELVDLLGGGTRAGAALMAKQSRKHKSKPDGDAAKDERSVTDIQRSLDGTTASAAAYKKKHDGNDGPDRP